MKISFSQFLAAVEANEGEILRTAGGEATFLAKRTERGVQFTPTSSGKPRKLSRAQIEPYIDYFNRTGSTTTSDYANRRNHSYVPAIFKIILGQHVAAKPWKAPQGQRVSRSPSMGAILLKWMDDESRNYTDVLPLKLFATPTPKHGEVHDTRGPNGMSYRAKCNVTVRGLVADLDYERFAAFNTRHEMLLGVARLHFADADRTAIQRVQWKPKGADKFKDCQFESPQFEVPPAPPYTPPSGASKKRARMVRERPGQAAFRRELKSVYGNRCCITGCTVSEALEGAHIDPYKAPASDSIRNGLLLRRDVHALFDKHLISIEPGTLTVHVASKALGKAGYSELHGGKLTLPQDPSHHPDPGALERHWRRFKKDN